MAALLVAGTAAAASAEGGGKAGPHRCDRLTETTTKLQRELDRFDRKLQQADGPDSHRLAKLQHHHDRLEQKLQSLQANCRS